MYLVVHTFVVLHTYYVHIALFVCFLCRTSHPVSREASDVHTPKNSVGSKTRVSLVPGPAPGLLVEESLVSKILQACEWFDSLSRLFLKQYIKIMGRSYVRIISQSLRVMEDFGEHGLFKP